MKITLLSVTVAAATLVLTTSVMSQEVEPFGSTTVKIDNTKLVWPVWTCRKNRLSAHENIDLDLRSNEPNLKVLNLADAVSLQLSYDNYTYFKDLPANSNLAELKFSGTVEGVNKLGDKRTSEIYIISRCLEK